MDDWLIKLIKLIGLIELIGKVLNTKFQRRELKRILGARPNDWSLSVERELRETRNTEPKTTNYHELQSITTNYIKSEARNFFIADCQLPFANFLPKHLNTFQPTNVKPPYPVNDFRFIFVIKIKLLCESYFFFFLC